MGSGLALRGASACATSGPAMESAIVQLLDEPPLMEVELHDKAELVTPPAQVRTPLSLQRFCSPLFFSHVYGTG